MTLWMRVIVFVAVFALLIFAIFHIDLVHSDPGIPIEDLPFIIGGMAFVSWQLFHPKRVRCRAAIFTVVLVCVAIASWIWARSQYQKVASVRLDGVSLAFPGLYYPKGTLRYTYTVLAETGRPHDDVERAISSALKTRGVRVSELRILYSN